MITKDEQKRIALIKRDFDTRNKWSKQDYSDFYFCDVSLLLRIIDRVFKLKNPNDVKRKKL